MLHIWRVNAATDVFPLVPVTAAIVCGWRGRHFAAARASARRGVFDANKSNRTAATLPAGCSAGNRHRTGRDRLLGEMRAIGLGASNGEEDETWLHLAAVGGNAGRSRSHSCSRIDRRLRQKIAQLHRVSFALTNSIWSAFGRSKRGGMSRSGATRSMTFAPTGTGIPA